VQEWPWSKTGHCSLYSVGCIVKDSPRNSECVQSALVTGVCNVEEMSLLLQVILQHACRILTRLHEIQLKMFPFPKC